MALPRAILRHWTTVFPPAVKEVTVSIKSPLSPLLKRRRNPVGLVMSYPTVSLGPSCTAQDPLLPGQAKSGTATPTNTLQTHWGTCPWLSGLQGSLQGGEAFL